MHANNGTFFLAILTELCFPHAASYIFIILVITIFEEKSFGNSTALHGMRKHQSSWANENHSSNSQN